MDDPPFGLPPGDFPVYHWSPTDRRDSILERGLLVRSVSHSAPIRYPMLCFAIDPASGWSMTADSFPDVDGGWDLWQVWASDLRGFEVIPTDDGFARELRVYRSIPARAVRYVASRDVSVVAATLPA